MKATLSSLHHQGADWLRELEFYQQELGILTSRLEEVITKNNAPDIRSKVEHFQNKFILLREQLDELKHDIGRREKEIEQMVKERPTHINEKFSATKDNVLARMKDFVQSIADTRFEFNTFLAKVL